jgi:hypothetical protein
MAFLFTDLHECKKFLELDPDDLSEDARINFLIEYASNWISDWLNRPELLYQQRTEYYDGRGTQKLGLNCRPVFYDANRPITVRIDMNGGYGQVPGSFTGNPLTYGSDYFLKLDSGDDPALSRCGILIRNGGLWPRPYARTNPLLTPFMITGFGGIQVQYYGGYTVDTLPGVFRLACNMLVGRLRFVLPIGFQLGSDSYQEKSINISQGEKNYFLGHIVGMLQSYKNFNFGRQW